MPISNDRVLSKTEIDKRDTDNNNQLLRVAAYCSVPDLIGCLYNPHRDSEFGIIALPLFLDDGTKAQGGEITHSCSKGRKWMWSLCAYPLG